MGLAALGLGFAAGLGFDSLTCFMGAPQQTMSHSSQPQSSCTKTTSPHSSHLYCSPFFFTKNFTFQKAPAYRIVFYKYKNFLKQSETTESVSKQKKLDVCPVYSMVAFFSFCSFFSGISMLNNPLSNLAFELSVSAICASV